MGNVISLFPCFYGSSHSTHFSVTEQHILTQLSSISQRLTNLETNTINQSVQSNQLSNTLISHQNSLDYIAKNNLITKLSDFEEKINDIQISNILQAKINEKFESHLQEYRKLLTAKNDSQFDISKIKNNINNYYICPKFTKYYIDHRIQIKRKFRSGIYYKHKVYFTPYDCEVIGVMDVLDKKFYTIPIACNYNLNSYDNNPIYNRLNTSQKYFNSIVAKKKIYYIPNNSSSIGVLNTVDDDWRVIKMSDNMKMESKFRGGIFINNCIYCTPYNSNEIGIIDTDSDSYRRIVLTRAESNKGNKYRGSIYHNETLYFIPYCEDSIGLLHIPTQEFTTIYIGDFINGNYKFCGGILYQDVIYFTPYSSHEIGVYSTVTQKFSMINIQYYTSVCNKFHDAHLINGSIYYIPHDANSIGVYNIQLQKFSMLDLGIKENMKFSMGIVVKENLYLCPLNCNRVVKLDTSTKKMTYVSPTLEGTYYFHGCVGSNQKEIYFCPHNSPYVAVLDLD